MTETPRFIPSRYGEMFIIEHIAPDAKPDTWVIALNSGLQCRTGPQRLYLRLARQLSTSGYGVIRADLPGVGDSDGPTPPTHFDLHDPINVKDIVRYVEDKYQPENLLVFGLCAGARASIKAAGLNPEIDGVIALSMPTFTASPGSARSPEESENRMSKTVARHNVDRLTSIVKNKRLMDPSFWKYYLNPKRALHEVVYVMRSMTFLASTKRGADHLGQFLKKLVAFAKNDTKKLFIFGERDKIICKEFEELDLDIRNGDVVMIPDGTHTFSTYSSHRQVVDETAKWLRDHFPVRTDGPV